MPFPADEVSGIPSSYHMLVTRIDRAVIGEDCVDIYPDVTLRCFHTRSFSEVSTHFGNLSVKEPTAFSSYSRYGSCSPDAGSTTRGETTCCGFRFSCSSWPR